MCADYETNPPVVTEAGFTSYQDQASGGNLPLDEMTSTVTTSLDEYWALAVVEAHRADRRGRHRERSRRW